MAKKLDKNVVSEIRQEVKTRKIQDNLEEILAQADDEVAKHKTVIALVAQCLEKHSKSHDEKLSERLYEFFDKELQ